MTPDQLRELLNVLHTLNRRVSALEITSEGGNWEEGRDYSDGIEALAQSLGIGELDRS